MKIFAGLVFAALMTVGSSFATTYYATGNCASWIGSNVPPQSGGPVQCALSVLGTGTGLQIVGEFIVYTSDFTGPSSSPSGLSSQVDTTVTTFTFSGTTFAYSTDTLTSTGTPAQGSSSGPVSTNGVFSTNSGMTLVGGPPVISGFDDAITASLAGGFIAPTVQFLDSTTTGSVQGTSGNIQVVYEYTTGAPEPVSMLLFGSGLLVVSLIGRKKFARK